MDKKGMEQMPLDLKSLVRNPDHTTSVDAARALKESSTLNNLQARIAELFQILGDMTDEELENQPEFDHYAYSTVRKRRTELYQQGRLVQRGTKTNSRGQTMKIWGVK